MHDDRLTLRQARKLVATYRAYTPDSHPWASQADAFMAGPLLVAEAHAAADMIEHLLDTHGVEGLDIYREMLHVRESLIPRASDADECGCINHDLATHSAAMSPAGLMADYTRVAMLLGATPASSPMPAARAARPEDTRPIAIVA